MPRKISLVLFVASMCMAGPLTTRAQQAPPATAVPAPPASQPQGQQPPPQQSTNPSSQPPAAPATPTPNALTPAAWAMLEHGAASEKSRDRSDAITALAIVGNDSRGVAMIEKGLTDKEVAIRVLAATSLGEIKARSAIPKLMDAVDDNAPQVSFAAVRALWKMGDRSSRALLYEILAGERKTGPGVMKGKMNKAMADMHDPKALALIGINEASGALLGPFSMGISFIEDYARNNSSPVQALCAQMLAEDDSSETADQLLDAVNDKNWVVRASAAKALAKLGHPRVIPQLTNMMQNDNDQPARFAAAAAIIRLSPRTTKASPAALPAKPAKTS